MLTNESQAVFNAIAAAARSGQLAMIEGATDAGERMFALIVVLPDGSMEFLCRVDSFFAAYDLVETKKQ